MDHVTLKVECACGYAGKRGRHRAYIARITGSSDGYIFAREFLETTAEDRAAMMTARRKGRGTWTEVAAVGLGIYEIQHSDGTRGYRIVRPASEREAAEGKAPILRQTIDADRAQRIALLLDQGVAFDDARRATMPPKATPPQAEGGAL